MKQPLVILTGPTAVGKTKLSLDLAEKINGEIISADSMQVYKQMDIGTAKITVEEMRGIKHYLIDEFEPDDEFNVVCFKNLAQKYIEEIYSKGKIPIIVGGTGFYIQAILYDIDFQEMDSNTTYRDELTTLLKLKGNDYLHMMLKEVDPDSAKSIHPNNAKRVIRALEFHKKTGSPISKHNQEQSQNISPYNFAYFVLNTDRDLLYQRIDKRVDQMLQLGLIGEVENLIKRGYSKDLVSMQGLGYKEIISYLNQVIELDEAIYILKRDTRHFAKRQLTWFKREKDVIWVNRKETDEDNQILSLMLQHITQKELVVNPERL